MRARFQVRTVLAVRAAIAAAAAAAAACSSPSSGAGRDGAVPPPDAGADAAPRAGDAGDAGGPGPDAGPGCRETAARSWPKWGVELAHEQGGGTVAITDVMFDPLDISGRQYLIGREPMWEAVRFDVPAPATVYGARVQWGNLRGDAARPVRLGAYPDFGSNGFDYEHWRPLWEGDRCLSAADEGAWVDYALARPIEVDVPGPFFIAHQYRPEGGVPDPDSGEDPGTPAFRFDPTAHACEAYADCPSSVNLSEAHVACGDPPAGACMYTGVPIQFPYHYAVRLIVELRDTVAPEDRWFQPTDLTLGGRFAWGDYDGDGRDDLMAGGPRLFRNRGDGGFEEVTGQAIPALPNGSNGGVWGDYDNDGCLDYFATAGAGLDQDLLLRNGCAGAFEDATAASGVTDLQDGVVCNEDFDEEHSPTEAAAWVDLDADGLLDLYLANYECWPRVERGLPDPYYPDRVWRNLGDGTFEEWGAERGFTGVDQAGRGVSPIDADRDGDVDVLVSNYRLTRNLMFENLGDGTVAEVAAEWGLAGVNAGGAYGHTIGSAWLDLENDGDWDVVEANLAHPRFYHFSDRTMVLRNDGAQRFEDVAAASGIFYRETHSNPTVADFDNDGDTDLFITCVYDGRFSELYFNDGAGAFTQVNYQSGAVVYGGWGSAASDYDRDGDVDLVANTLFRNDTAAAGNHFLQVRAPGGVTANRAGIGAVVEVEAGGSTLLGHASGGSGTGCQDSLFLTFGLGASTHADSVRVTWPGGATVTADGPIEADQRVWIFEDGTVAYGWDPP